MIEASVDKDHRDYHAFGAAAEAIQAELQAGREPDAQSLAARYPQVASGIATLIDMLRTMPTPADDSTTPPRGAVPGGFILTPTVPIGAPRLGDFRIVREIGRGGMGVVYEAEQVSLGRRVALKVLPAGLGLDARQLQRFRNEAQTAAQLHHPHIVPVYAVGSEQGVHFFAMQLIDGFPLDDVIRAQRQEQRSGGLRSTAAPRPRGRSSADQPAALPSAGSAPTAAQLSTQSLAAATLRSGPPANDDRFTVQLVIDAADALEYAHEMNVIHRDVKPSNLILDEQGHVWVTDFGLAQARPAADLSDLASAAAPAAHGLTETGDVMGTIRYMSPEQAQGRRALIDRRTDVYSLGLTLYELLTLRPAFDESDRAALLQKVIAAEPRRPRRVRPEIPHDLETIVLKAIRRSPDERYATAGELAADLRRFLHHEPIHARRVPIARRVTLWRRRHRAWTSAAAILLALGLTAGAVFWNHELHARREAITRRTVEGYEWLATAQWPAAKATFDDVLATAPEQTDARRGRARALERLGESALALADYDLVVAQRGASAESLVERGEFHHRLIRYNDALADFDAALNADPTYAPAHLRRAAVHRDQRQWIAALDDYAQAMKLGAPAAEVLVERATLWNRRGQWTKADEDLTRAIASDPRWPTAFLHRAKARKELRRLDEALADGERAFALRAPLVNVLTIRGAIHVDAGQFERGLADAVQALALDPQSAMAFKVRADAYRQLGKRNLAADDYDAALKLTPDFQEAYVNRGVLRLATDRTAAMVDFRKALAVNPENVAAHTNIGAALSHRGDHAEALKSHAKALELDAQNWQALANRALTYAAMKEYEKAIADLTQAIKLHPDAANYTDLGNLYRETKRPDEALANYEQSIKLDPQYALAYNNRGAIRAERKQYDDALADFNKAIGRAPDSPLGYENRARLHRLRREFPQAAADYLAALKRGAPRERTLGRLTELWNQLDPPTSLEIMIRELSPPMRQSDDRPKP